MSRSSCGGVITLIEASAPSFLTIAPQPVKADTSLLLAPLDSRPPCSAMVRKLGQLQAYRRIIHKNRRRAAVMRAE